MAHAEKHEPHDHNSRNRHSHDHHDHNHAHGGIDADRMGRAFVVGIVLNIVYVAVEFGAGVWLDSMSLLSDAGHNFGDVIGLMLALLAFRLARVKPNNRFTYGYKKSTVLISLLNACILLVAVAMIVMESIEKLRVPQPIEGGSIAWVAGAGIVVNAATALLFMRGRKRDLNVQGAFLHMAADALVSVGVVVSGLVIRATGWYVVDPIMGIVVAVVIVLSTARLLMSSLRLSLDGVPRGIDPDEVRRAMMASADGVSDIHHLHIWAISTTCNALTAHVAVADTADVTSIKERFKHVLSERGISHVTLEFEYPGETCGEGQGCGLTGC